MKLYYKQHLDPVTTHANIAGVNTPDLAEIEKTIVTAVCDRLTHLPLNKRSGAGVIFLSAGATARSYKFPMNGVKVVATLTTRGIRVDEISREKRYPKTPQRVQVALTDAQKDIIAQKAVSYALSAT